MEVGVSEVVVTRIDHPGIHLYFTNLFENGYEVVRIQRDATEVEDLDTKLLSEQR